MLLHTEWVVWSELFCRMDKIDLVYALGDATQILSHTFFAQLDFDVDLLST